MLDEIIPLPEDPEELRAFTARLLAEVKAQAILIEKLRHQLAGHRAHRFGASSETAEQLQLALETSEIAAAAMTARLRLPDVGEKGQPKRRPIPDHVPRMVVEISPTADACADCGGHRLADDADAARTGALRGFLDRTTLHLCGADRHAHEHSWRWLQHAVAVYLVDEVLQHLFGVGEVGDHAVLHRTHGGDVPRRAA